MIGYATQSISKFMADYSEEEKKIVESGDYSSPSENVKANSQN